MYTYTFYLHIEYIYIIFFPSFSVFGSHWLREFYWHIFVLVFGAHKRLYNYIYTYTCFMFCCLQMVQCHTVVNHDTTV